MKQHSPHGCDLGPGLTPSTASPADPSTDQASNPAASADLGPAAATDADAAIAANTGASPASDPAIAADPGFLEAGAVHELLKALHGIGNEVRLRFLDALRMLHDGDLCLELGYSSFHQYCDRELGLARSTSLEYVRVGHALDGLPRLRAMFAHGELSWEQVRAISRVATSDTEIPWIELAFEEPVRSLLAEVREARRTGRDLPRDKRLGLPNLMVRLYLDLTVEDKARVRAAFELVSASSGPDLGGGPDDQAGRDESPSDGRGDVRVTDQRPPLVRWADGILSGAIPVCGATPDRGSGSPAVRPAPAQTILYRTCPECRESTLDSVDGPISVAPERVAELAAVANRVDIAPEEELRVGLMPAGQLDEPNSPRLARKVLHRDGLRCANPGCGRRRNLHAHHIVYRSQGGRTVLSNEVAVCDTCHALLHQGLLEVAGSPDTGLTWRPRPMATGVKVRDAAALSRRLRELGTPIVAAFEAPAGGPAQPRDGRSSPSRRLDHGTRANGAPPNPNGLPGTKVSRRLDTHTVTDDEAPTSPGSPAIPQSTRQDTANRVSDLAEGLVKLGCPRRESVHRVRSAIATLTAERLAELRTDDGAEDGSGSGAADGSASGAADGYEAEAGHCSGHEQRDACEQLDDATIIMRALRG